MKLPKFVKNLLDGTADGGEPVNESDKRSGGEQFSRQPVGAAQDIVQPSARSEPGAGDNNADAERDGNFERPFFTRREPDSPFHQHFFRTRAEFLRSPGLPKILISDHAYRRMCLIVETAPKEVGWLGTVDRLPSGNFYIDEVFVPAQEVTGSETDPTDEGQFDVMSELVEQGEEGMKKIERLRFWGHSHVHMGTSASGTDENTPLNYQRLGLPWFIRGIFNKLGRAEFTVYLFHEGHRFLDVPWEAVDAQTGEVLPIGRAEKRDWGSTQPISADAGTNRTEFKERGPGFASPYEPPPILLPSKLVASKAERMQVRDELAAKLTERKFRFFGGWGGGERTVEENTGDQRSASPYRDRNGLSHDGRSDTTSGAAPTDKPKHRLHLTGGEE